MKTFQAIHVFCAAAFLLASAPLNAQAPEFYSWSSEHYEVRADSTIGEAQQIAVKLEAALGLFNGFLHYDLGRLGHRMKVRIFSDKTAYDGYLERLIEETRSDFVYISYSDSARSELVGFKRDEREFNASLLHYGFIQFLSAYVPSAPLWIEEGTATYLEYSRYDPEQASFQWQANYAWLDTLKRILSGGGDTGKMSLRDLLLIDKQTAQGRIDVFYPSAWGLVHFLLQSPEKRYNRILWDALEVLQPDATLMENSRRVLETAFGWVDLGQLEQDFQAYIMSLLSFNDLVRLGVQHYGAGELQKARSSFQQALELATDNPVPYYYLGLIAYQDQDYESARSNYLQALKQGIQPALAHYALGVNAFAERNYDEAKKHLLEAKEQDAEAYAEKVDRLLKRIELMR